MVDILGTGLGLSSGRLPISEACKPPFLAPKDEAASRVFQSPVAATARAEGADVHPIRLHTHIPGLAHLRDDALATLEAIAGLTVRGATRIVTGTDPEATALRVGALALTCGRSGRSRRRWE